MGAKTQGVTLGGGGLHVMYDVKESLQALFVRTYEVSDRLGRWAGALTCSHPLPGCAGAAAALCRHGAGAACSRGSRSSLCSPSHVVLVGRATFGAGRSDAHAAQHRGP